MKGIAFYEENFPVIKEDSSLISENIKRLLLTLPGEWVGNPSWGCTLRNYIFNFENTFSEEAEQSIINAITKWEPRVAINDISMKKDPEIYGKYYITVNVMLKENLEDINLELIITE